MFENEELVVTVKVKNYGLRELTNIVIKDSFPNEFKLIKGSKSIKIPQLNAGETVNFSYTLKPLKIGEYKLPPAVVFYKAPPPLSGEVSKESKSVYVRVVETLTPTPLNTFTSKSARIWCNDYNMHFSGCTSLWSSPSHHSDNF